MISDRLKSLESQAKRCIEYQRRQIKEYYKNLSLGYQGYNAPDQELIDWAEAVLELIGHIRSIQETPTEPEAPDESRKVASNTSSSTENC